MNAIMERWIQTCRHELLNRTLIFNERHLRHALHQFELHYNTHRPHQAKDQSAPLRAVSAPLPHTHQPTEGAPDKPPRRSAARVPTCRFSGADGVFGRRRVQERTRDAPPLVRRQQA
ncbi:integrase core domain-containing protein [Streptomyces sp. NPDC054871]